MMENAMNPSRNGRAAASGAGGAGGGEEKKPIPVATGRLLRCFG